MSGLLCVLFNGGGGGRERSEIPDEKQDIFSPPYMDIIFYDLL